MVGPIETLLRGLLLAGLLLVPGVLLVRAAWPSARAGLLLLAGSVTGLFVVPSLAFGVALLVGSNLRLPLLGATSTVLVLVALLWARFGPTRAGDPSTGRTP